MDKVHYGEVTSFNESSTVLGICDRVRLNNNKNSSGDEMANGNFLRRHRIRTCRGQRLRLRRLPTLPSGWVGIGHPAL